MSCHLGSRAKTLYKGMGSGMLGGMVWFMCWVSAPKEFSWNICGYMRIKETCMENLCICVVFLSRLLGIVEKEFLALFMVKYSSFIQLSEPR